MPNGQVLEFSGVTKHFGGVTAVAELSARVEPGVVTGFLGPNGAGKTTSLRILLGLVRASAGRALIGGTEYAALRDPLRTVGAVLEASSFHPGRTAANHLRVYARAATIPNTRVDEVLGLVGLADVAGRKVGGFSLGMRQRLGLAYALLGDPGVLVLDEPANGLDPEGIRWMRGFMREFAREGRTVLVSSHLLTEVQQTVDAILVIARGRLVFQGGLDELADPSEYATVVDAPDRAALGAALSDAGVAYELLRSGLTVRGAEPVEVGAIAAASGVALSALQRRGPALEEVFLALVNGERVHASAAGAGAGAAAGLAPVGVDAAADAAPGTGALVAGAAAVGMAGEGADDDVEGDVVDAAGGAPDAAGDGGASAPAEDAAPDADAGPDAAVEGSAPDETATVAAQADNAPATDRSWDDAEAREAAAVAADLDAASGASPAAFAATSMGAWTVSDDGTIEDARPVDAAPADEGAAGFSSGQATEGTGDSAPEEPSAATAAFSVASTGIIDIVPAAASMPTESSDTDTDTDSDTELPEDADPDVEAIGAVDDELESALTEDRTGRPGENDPRTDSDDAADAFFAAFDDSARSADASQAAPSDDAEASTRRDDQPHDAGPPGDAQPDDDRPEDERPEGGEQR